MEELLITTTDTPTPMIVKKNKLEYLTYGIQYITEEEGKIIKVQIPWSNILRITEVISSTT